MTVTKPATVPKTFDEVKLQSMQEPLTVRVEKVKLGRRHQIPLPESEEAPGQAGGVGYDIPAVRALEQYLVTEWSGGGDYVISVIDATGQKMEWNASYPISDYPERIPPPLQNAAAPTPTLVAPATRRTPMAPAFSTGFPTFGQVQQPMQQQQPQYGYPYPLPPPPPIGSPAYGMWREEARERTESAELKALREENARREREALQAKHQADLDRERRENEARFAKQESAMGELRGMIKDLATSFQTSIANLQTNTANAAAANKNPELEAIKAQLAAAEKAAEAANRDRERREFQDLIKAMNEQSQRQIEAMQRQLEAFQQSLTAVNANKHDPMIEMLKEQTRASNEAIKEVARQSADAITKLQSASLQPRDILSFAKESSQATDQITDRLTSQFGRIMDLQARATETALQLQPQGSPVVDMIREGAGNLKDMAERFFSGKELQQKLEQAKHQQVLEAQRDVEIARIQATAGLSGTQPQVVYQDAPQIQIEAPKRQRRGKQAPIDATAETGPRVKKILGKTEAQWFGPVESEIGKLRGGVASFVDALRNGATTEADLPDDAIDPESAAFGINKAIQMVTQAQLRLPIIDDLLAQHRYSDFMDVMLPDAPEQYKADVLNVLIPLLRGETGGGARMTGEEAPAEAAEAGDQNDADEADADEDDDEGGDDDADGDPDDGDDSAQDGAETSAPRGAAQLAVVKGPAPVKNGRPVNPPRRA